MIVSGCLKSKTIVIPAYAGMTIVLIYVRHLG